MRFPRLAHRSAAAHKLHSTPQQDRMNLISGKGETSSRLPAFSLFLPGSCPNYRDRRTRRRRVPAAGWVVAWEVAYWGLLLWLPGFLAGAGVFAVFLITFTKMLQHPPELPTNRNDVTACSDFILNTNPFDYYNPFQDLEDWLKRHTG